jgi:phosphoribosylaminoimidazolecarboxamide formyltransferase / IMP cyclohydrolase
MRQASGDVLESSMSRAVRRALLSVSNKTGLVDFASALHAMGIALISTGGTAQSLRAADLPVTDVAEVTGSPEILDGRVKTLHPRIHAALLADMTNSDHRSTLAELGLEPIDLLVANLYPFEDTIASGATFQQCIETIDVGGPAMIRAAAKNHRSVAVVVDPDDYSPLLAELRANSAMLGNDTKIKLAAKAFSRTAVYDAAIGAWFRQFAKEETPEYFVEGGRNLMPLRYGENPHQTAGYYGDAHERWQQVQGKELSYNNINDMDAAWQCVLEFKDQPACVIVKHANPCGVAVAKTQLEAYRLALACDPTSAYGGIVAFNQGIDEETAEEVLKIFTEVLIAPSISEAAIGRISTRPNLRLISAKPEPQAGSLLARQVMGGLLVQSADDVVLLPEGLKTVTKRVPRPSELEDMIFAFTVAKHVKSNAIVFAKNLATVGIGAGQMSRLDSTRIATLKAAEAARQLGVTESLARNSVVASDAFFPFPDALLAAVEAGATAAIQPGGSMRDEEIIAAADQAGLAMVFTGIRHFRH